MFEGFSDQTIDFMWGIRFNNERAWFEAHREEYRSFLHEPMHALGHAVRAELAECCPEPELCLKVARIYRDARRLHGQGPYRDHLWFCLRGPDDDAWTARPSFWFELTPEGYSYGLGYYAATPGTMAKFRARLDKNPKPFEKLARACRSQNEFLLEGEAYKRPKGEVSALLSPWYNRKNLALSCDRPLGAELYSPRLVSQLTAGFTRLHPLYRYFLSLEGDPDPRQP